MKFLFYLLQGGPLCIFNTSYFPQTLKDVLSKGHNFRMLKNIKELLHN